MSPLLPDGGIAPGQRDGPARRHRSEAGPGRRGTRGPLWPTTVAAVLTVMLMRSIDLGQLDTSMAAISDLTLGGTQRVGILFAAIAGVSIVGGLTFGAAGAGPRTAVQLAGLHSLLQSTATRHGSIRSTAFRARSTDTILGQSVDVDEVSVDIAAAEVLAALSALVWFATLLGVWLQWADRTGEPIQDMDPLGLLGSAVLLASTTGGACKWFLGLMTRRIEPPS